MNRIFAIAALAVVLTAPVVGRPAAAADRKASLLDAVTRCRAIVDPAERVGCYDRSVEALQAAEQKREIAVVDRAQARETRRSLFGLTLPRLPVLGDVDDGGEVKQIEATVASASIDAGAWVVRLSDGSNWRQIDDNELGRRPRAGDKVVVKRAALGSFRMMIAGMPGIKVRREG